MIAANTSFPIAHTKDKAVKPYFVQRKNTEHWNTSDCFATYQEAHPYIVAKMERYPNVSWRILIHRQA
ncbi:hypothetical protein Axy09_001 [Achromobacter phage vB_AxyP_19-32_Axy09]|uniref:Uncharacterized protein n=2 Tax=Axyvirus TaxID=3424993 RepID=A0A514CW46_9CAUD|nr:hypothetical protein Axy09_001 [Achromobacter phage vB_AxyP_19-32_Axy09]QDH84717.1 hypothetical protein Axy23_001 [Achromobacter phage vB_AxyP_19-32_Axy23]